MANFKGPLTIGHPVFVTSRSQLPYSTVEALRGAEVAGHVLIGITEDAARQWLSRSPDSPASYRVASGAILVAAFLFPVVLPVIAWNFIQWYALLTFPIAVLSLCFLRHSWRGTRSGARFVLILGLLAMLITPSQPMFFWFGLSIVTPWLLNRLNYKHASSMVRRAVLDSQPLFDHIFNAGELRVLHIPTDELFCYPVKTALPPPWFFESVHRTDDAPPPEPEPTRGLGMTRADMQTLFESKEVGFAFENASPIRGHPRVMGTSQSGLATIELIGPPYELTSALITIGVVNDNVQSNHTNFSYVHRFLVKAVPDWEGAANWFIPHAIEAMKSGKASTIQGDREILLQARKGTALLVVTVRAAP